MEKRLAEKDIEELVSFLRNEADFCSSYAQELENGVGGIPKNVRKTLLIQAEIFSRWANSLQ